MDNQTADGFIVSSTKARVRIKELGINLRVHLVDESPSVCITGPAV